MISKAGGLGIALAFSLGSQAAENTQTLWQIGQADNSIAEFALAPGDYARFLQQFGSPDHAYYIGVSKVESDWPYVLPGPLDNWGGSSNGRWDQMNTLPIGFVLARAAAKQLRADHRRGRGASQHPRFCGLPNSTILGQGCPRRQPAALGGNGVGQTAATSPGIFRRAAAWLQ